MKQKRSQKSQRKSNGDTLKIEGTNWKDAVKRALAKKPPETGVPPRQTKTRAKRKAK